MKENRILNLILDYHTLEMIDAVSLAEFIAEDNLGFDVKIAWNSEDRRMTVEPAGEAGRQIYWMQLEGAAASPDSAAKTGGTDLLRDLDLRIFCKRKADGILKAGDLLRITIPKSCEEQEYVITSVCRRTVGYYVSPAGDAIPAQETEFYGNLELMRKENNKYVGETSTGPVRVRVEDAHPKSENYTGCSDNDHETPHIHVEHREKKTSGRWGKGVGNKVSLPQSRLKAESFGGTDMNGTVRSDIRIGAEVDIVLKKDQRTGKLTRGHVKRILTNSSVHPRGIKVMLEEGDQVGRVRRIVGGENK